MCSQIIRAVAALALMLASAISFAQAPALFAIQSYRVQGNSLISTEQVDAATQPHTGPQSSFETIQLALEALEKAYVTAGYGSVQVEIPPQELESGIVTLQVIEGVLGNVIIEPNAYFDEDNLRHSLPALRLEKTVNILALNRNLMLANEGGAKITNVTFKRNPNNRDVDAAVKVTAENPQRWFATLDNTGSASTGHLRTGLVYQNANLFNRDHSLSLQLMTSPDHINDVHILGLGYHLPLYAQGDALDFNVSSSNVNSGQVAQAGGGADLAISGSGTILGARYTHNLEASAESQRSVSLGLEHRAYGNSVAPVGGGASLVPDLLTRPLILSFVQSLHTDARDISFHISLLKNLPGGTNGSSVDFNQPGGRTGADANFKTLKFSVQHTERFESQWLLRTAVSGQYTSDLLIAAEQFGAGGTDSVRGLVDREIAGDAGLRAGMEVWAPPLSADPWRMIPLAFLEAATVRRNQPGAGELDGQSVASTGLGLRGAYGRHINARLDWGYVLKGVSGTTGPVKGDQKIHASMMVIF